MKFVKTVRKENSSYKIYLPHEIVKVLGIKEGDIVQMEIIKVRKVEE